MEQTVLRKAELKVASIRAQEWLGWAMLEEGKNRHKEPTFNLKTMRAVPSLEQPLMHLDMLTGQADASGDLNTKPPSDSDVQYHRKKHTLASWYHLMPSQLSNEGA